MAHEPWPASTARAKKILPFASAQREGGAERDAETRRAAFDAEALPHAIELFRAAVRMTGDRARAEDAVQETFLQAWKSFDRFDPGSNCRAWLYKILFHCVKHQRRKWFRFTALSEREEQLPAAPAEPIASGGALQDAQILAALDRIPAEFRALVLLVDVEEFGYREAAEILGIPIGTVMSRLSRGRKQLRAQLEEVARSYGIVKEKGDDA